METSGLAVPGLYDFLRETHVQKMMFGVAMHVGGCKYNRGKRRILTAVLSRLKLAISNLRVCVKENPKEPWHTEGRQSSSGTPQPHRPGSVLNGSAGQPSRQSVTPSPSESACATVIRVSGLVTIGSEWGGGSAGGLCRLRGV